jgi:hypothetical protein
VYDIKEEIVFWVLTFVCIIQLLSESEANSKEAQKEMFNTMVSNNK